MADQYSFRPPRGSHAMRRSVAVAIKASEQPGVTELVDDIREGAVVYVVCTRAAWTKLLAAAVKHSGCERKGDRRRLLFSSGAAEPACCSAPQYEPAMNEAGTQQLEPAHDICVSCGARRD